MAKARNAARRMPMRTSRQSTADGGHENARILSSKRKATRSDHDNPSLRGATQWFP